MYLVHAKFEGSLSSHSQGIDDAIVEFPEAPGIAGPFAPIQHSPNAHHCRARDLEWAHRENGLVFVKTKTNCSAKLLTK